MGATGTYAFKVPSAKLSGRERELVGGGASARQNRDVSIASDYKSVKWGDEIFNTSRLPDNLFDLHRTASARNGVATNAEGQRHMVVVICQR